MGVNRFEKKEKHCVYKYLNADLQLNLGFEPLSSL